MTQPYRFKIETIDGPAIVTIDSGGWHEGGRATVERGNDDDPSDILPVLTTDHFMSTAIGYRGHALNPDYPRPVDLYFALEGNRPGVNVHRNPDITGYEILSGNVPDDPAADPNGDRGVNTDYGRERGLVD